MNKNLIDVLASIIYEVTLDLAGDDTHFSKVVAASEIYNAAPDEIRVVLEQARKKALDDASRNMGGCEPVTVFTF